MKNDIETLKALLGKRRPKKGPINPADLLSTGSTLLNLACSGRKEGGFLKGGYYFFVGDSDSGKTFLCLTCLAEASINPVFKDHRFIFDNVELGARMDMRKLFGQKVVDRLEAPSKDKAGNPLNSSTIEDLYFHLDDAQKDGRPFIYILDSMDALGSEGEDKKFTKDKAAARKAKNTGEVEEQAGSYGDGKAKKNSQGLRMFVPKLARTGSILIIINQTRDNIAKFSFKKDTRAGGRALKFYATLEMWSKGIGRLKKKVNDKDRQMGIISQISVEKNRLTGKEWTIKQPIYHSVGIDDLGACIDFLLEEKHWKKGTGGIKVPEWDGISLHREKLIAYIEKHNLEEELRDIVVQVWQGIEAATTLVRKSRYV